MAAAGCEHRTIVVRRSLRPAPREGGQHGIHHLDLDLRPLASPDGVDQRLTDSYRPQAHRADGGHLRPTGRTASQARRVQTDPTERSTLARSVGHESDNSTGKPRDTREEEARCCTTRLIDWRPMTACNGCGAKLTRTI
jgi:hypothetical protein